MSTIKLQAGPFLHGKGQVKKDKLVLPVEGKFWPEEVLLKDIQFEIATEENVKKMTGTIGWGAVGAIALGPVGLMAGLLLGGRKKEVTFIGQISDGRRFLATTDNATYVKLCAGSF